MRGGRRKSTAQKEAEGTARRDRANPKEPKYEAAIPPAPSWMSSAAAREWKRVAPELHAQRLLARVDMAVLVAYCELLAEFADLTKRIAKGERFMVEPPARQPGTKGSRAAAKKYPLAKERRDAVLRLVALAGELGMTPAARSKVSALGDGEDEDLLQQLMRKKAERAATPPRPN